MLSSYLRVCLLELSQIGTSVCKIATSRCASARSINSVHTAVLGRMRVAYFLLWPFVGLR